MLCIIYKHIITRLTKKVTITPHAQLKLGLLRSYIIFIKVNLHANLMLLISQLTLDISHFEYKTHYDIVSRSQTTRWWSWWIQQPSQISHSHRRVRLIIYGSNMLPHMWNFMIENLWMPKIWNMRLLGKFCALTYKYTSVSEKSGMLLLRSCV